MVIFQLSGVHCTVSDLGIVIVVWGLCFILGYLDPQGPGSSSTHLSQVVQILQYVVIMVIYGFGNILLGLVLGPSGILR